MNNITSEKDSELLSFATTQNLNEIQNPSKENVTSEMEKVNNKEENRYSINVDENYIKMKAKHKEMTDDVIKKIFTVINDSLVIMQSKKKGSRIVWVEN